MANKRRSQLNATDIIAAAKDNGIPPALALAIWDQESQMGRATTPLTHQEKNDTIRGEFQVADNTFKQFFPKGNPDDPDLNMLAGIKYIAQKYLKYGGDLASTAQAYHSGSAGIYDTNGVLKKDRTGKITGVYADDIVNKYRDIVNGNPALGKPGDLSTTKPDEQTAQLPPPPPTDLFGTAITPDSYKPEPEPFNINKPDQAPAVGQLDSLAQQVNPQLDSLAQQVNPQLDSLAQQVNGRSSMPLPPPQPTMYGQPMTYWDELKRQSDQATEDLDTHIRDMVKEVENEDAVRL